MSNAAASTRRDESPAQPAGSSSRDPFDDAMVEAHADAVVQLMVGNIDEEIPA